MLTRNQLVRWSELGYPKMPGTHRISDHRVVQVGYPLIEQYDRIGEDPLVEITKHPRSGVDHFWIAVGFVEEGSAVKEPLTTNSRS